MLRTTSGSLSLLHTAHLQSPLFAAFSPSLDPGDVSSDDGDSLFTPLTEHHDHRLHPCEIYEYTQDIYAVDPNQPSDSFLHTEKSHYGSPVFPRPSPSLTSSVSESPSHDSLFSQLSPTSTLDAPTTSRKNTSFSSPRYFPSCDFREDDALGFPSPSYASSALDPTASPFTPTRNTLQPNSPNFSASPYLPPDASPSGSKLSSLPSLTLSNIGCDDSDDPPSLLLSPRARNESILHPTRGHHERPPSPLRADIDICVDPVLCRGRRYSSRFYEDHMLNPYFVQTYSLQDELGAGGYGFVMTAQHRTDGHEVAVKFIIKDKVPEHAWWEDDVYGRIPTEVMILSLVNHENIVKCLDLFEDEVYYYLVQELHGTPWVPRKQKAKHTSAPERLVVPTPVATPMLSPSSSCASTVDSGPRTPPDTSSGALRIPVAREDSSDFASNLHQQVEEKLLSLPTEEPPKFTRRPSHDLFECIEQSKHKRLSESQAKYVFAQVVEAVWYLDRQGITHCDIKDENLVVDADLKVKLIDFGSAVVTDPTRERPLYHQFFGTTAYASSEILLKQPYHAPAAEIWTLGVLLSYLLTGHSPFPTEQDAKDGRVVIREPKNSRLSRSAISLMARCLEKEPVYRAHIDEVRNHPWLRGALESRGRD